MSPEWLYDQEPATFLFLQKRMDAELAVEDLRALQTAHVREPEKLKHKLIRRIDTATVPLKLTYDDNDDPAYVAARLRAMRGKIVGVSGQGNPR